MTSSSTKVSSCADCRTPIIGDRSRCRACSYHANIAMTASRSLQRGVCVRQVVAAIEILGIVTFALVLLLKGCS